MSKILLAFGILVFSAQLLAQSIELTWVTPEVREDGTAIQSIDRFNIYHSIDNVIQDSIEVSATDISYTVSEAQEGIHVFQISTVELGQEGEKSAVVSAPILAPVVIVISKPTYPSLTVRVIN
ncbi:hypothetical protein OAP25_02215 [Flavobacteriaceae bacterium]|nr:hypothetical protein [Flavobacteriaceae bacterium]